MSTTSIVEQENSDDDVVTFKSLGIEHVLCQACEKMKWNSPTPIQKSVIPYALQGRDIIGLAETGSGKTGAFALPILQNMLQYSQRLFALIITPTRELAFQIAEQFDILGAVAEVKTAVIIGGKDIQKERISLSKKPHIIIATPGRLIDHLENTEGFNLKPIKCLVLDEADRILDQEFAEEMDKILAAVPAQRNTYIFSATMTDKVEKLHRASLSNPVQIEVSCKNQTVEHLQQYQLYLPSRYKDMYLVYTLNKMDSKSSIVFCSTCVDAQRTALLLHRLGFHVNVLHGKLSQSKRLKVLSSFRSKKYSVLVATDVASRGLDIPHVDVVINFDLPSHPKNYIHRVGRTARAGKQGTAITFVTELTVNQFIEIEGHLGEKLPMYDYDHQQVLTLKKRVKEAQHYADKEMKELDSPNKSNLKRLTIFDDSDDDRRESKSKLWTKKKKFKIR